MRLGKANLIRHFFVRVIRVQGEDVHTGYCWTSIAGSLPE